MPDAEDKLDDDDLDGLTQRGGKTEKLPRGGKSDIPRRAAPSSRGKADRKKSGVIKKAGGTPKNVGAKKGGTRKKATGVKKGGAQKKATAAKKPSGRRKKATGRKKSK